MAGLMPMDMDPRASSHEKRKESKISKMKEHLSSIKTKLNPNDIRIQDLTGKPTVKEKSGPAYKFASELQQQTQNEELFEKLLKCMKSPFP